MEYIMAEEDRQQREGTLNFIAAVDLVVQQNV